MKNISWLHLSDLHMGNPHNEDSWPTIKNNIYQDIEQIFDFSGNIDFVLFSGDVTFSGQKEQFEKASIFLNELWEKFDSLGCSPYFLCVPGNHDLVRPDKLSPAALLLKMWENQADVQKDFWDPSSQYFQFIETAFANYSNWYQNINLPKPEHMKLGYVPGDFSCRFSVNGIDVGVVGLNSSFLHFADIDTTTDGVALSEKQLHHVTDVDPHSWSRSNTISILATHHGANWLTKKCKQSYRENIYIPSLFYSHFYGHMHDSYDFSLKEGGSEERRMRQGVSLFGIENTPSGMKRLHGYAMYKLTCDNSRIIESVKPRISTKLQNGTYKITPNPEYDLDENNILTRMIRTTNLDEPKSIKAEQANPIAPDTDTPLTNSISKEVLKQIGTDIPPYNSRHASIRIPELKHANDLLDKEQILWLKCDWGMGKDGFLSVLLKKQMGENKRSVFKIDLDDITAIDELQGSFRARFNVDMEEFIANVSQDERITFILDNIGSELTSSSDMELMTIIQILKDFHANSQYICTSRYSSHAFQEHSVELKALNPYEVGKYIHSNQDATPEMQSEDYIDLILVKSGSIPMLIDNIIEKLGVVSLDEIYSFEDEFEGITNDSGEPVPNALKYAINSLAHSDDNVSKRCQKLLKVLSFLPAGENLRKIMYMFQRTPFHANYAVQLQKLSLISTTGYPISLKLQSGEWLAIIAPSERILRVPRQIRNYVISNMPKREREDIVKKVAETLFGSDWRYGTLKITKANILSGRGAKTFGPGNEHEIIKHILLKATENEDEKEVYAALRIASSYCAKICDSNRFRDTILATKEILTMVDGYTSEYIGNLCITRAKALRMLGRGQEAIELTKYSITNKQISTKTDLASAHLNQALAYETAGANEDAVEAANKVKEYAPRGGAQATQAESIITQIGEGSYTLIELEKKSRNKEFTVVANNIALSLAKDEKDSDKKINYYNRIIDSHGDNYNTIRAATNKVNYLVDCGSIDKISSKDKQIVRYGYSLQYSQRSVGLFFSSHKALWNILKAENKINELFRVYRLSSLIWRLAGNRDEELIYLKDLKSIIKLDRKKGIESSMDYTYYRSRESVEANDL